MEKLQFLCEVRKVGSDNYKNAAEEGIDVTFAPGKKEGILQMVDVTLTNTKEDFSGVLHVKVKVPQQKPKFFMPGYMYGRNTGEKPNSGRKDFPRIREGSQKCPESEYWMTRSDRLAEPMSLIYDEGRVVGVSATPYWIGTKDKKKEAEGDYDSVEQPFYQYSGFTCRMNDDGQSSVGYTLGYENAPWLFIQSATVLERAELGENNSFYLASGESITFSLRVYDYPATDETGIYLAIKDVYQCYHQSPRKIEGMTIQKAVRMLSSAIRDAAWLEEEKMYSGFVYDTPGGDTYNKIGSLSWTNGLAVAVPMLLAANRLQDNRMRQQALAFIQEVVEHSLNPDSGLPYDAIQDGVWSVRGWWYDGMHSGGHSAYLTGQAIYYLLKAYVNEKNSRGIEHEEWLEYIKPVIEKVNQLKNTEEEYPFSMSERTGAGLEYDSMGGAWCLTATALYAQVTEDKTYEEGLKKSEQHYYEAFVQKAECYGGPLDTDKAVDNEGILAYVRAVRILHELTGEKIYLEHLRDGIYYELSFKLGYNTPVQVKPLCDIGWSSCGGSITSTANPHIHPMSSTIVDEMIYLVEQTGDTYVEVRLKDTVEWGLQTFNTKEKEYGYGRIGWMSERFCFCEGLVVERYPDGTPAGTWFALMPWASASIIEGYVGEAWDKTSD